MSCCYPNDSMENTTCRQCVPMPQVASTIWTLAILLRGFNFATDSLAITGCVVTSHVTTKLNSVTPLSATHTVLMCSQKRIPHHGGSNFQLHFWSQFVVCSSGWSGDWSFHLWWQSYNGRGVPITSAGVIVPAVGGCVFQWTRLSVIPTWCSN